MTVSLRKTWSVQEAAGISTVLRQAGQPIEEAVVRIAGTARAHGLVVITHNVRHFSRREGLEMADWLAVEGLQR